jgi:hypothetical protein
MQHKNPAFPGKEPHPLLCAGSRATSVKPAIKWYTPNRLDHCATSIVHKQVNVKVALQKAMKAQGRVLVNLGARWGGWLTPRPGRFTPGNKAAPIV